MICSTQSTAVSKVRTEGEKEREALSDMEGYREVLIVRQDPSVFSL